MDGKQYKEVKEGDCPLCEEPITGRPRRVQIAEKNMWEAKPGRATVCDPCVDTYQREVVPVRNKQGKPHDLEPLD